MRILSTLYLKSNILCFTVCMSDHSSWTCILWSLYPSNPVSLYPCIPVSLYPCIPVSLYTCIPVSLYPYYNYLPYNLEYQLANERLGILYSQSKVGEIKKKSSSNLRSGPS